MKRMIAVFLASALTLLLCGCSPLEETEFDPMPEPEVREEVQIANPLAECASLEELNEQTGAKFYRPGNAEPEEQYFIIGGETADYRFTVDGVSYIWRFAKQTEMDISGVYTEGGTAFATQLDKTELTFAEGDVLAARWCNAEGQYTVSADGGEADAEAFRAMATEFMLVTRAE